VLRAAQTRAIFIYFISPAFPRAAYAYLDPGTESPKFRQAEKTAEKFERWEPTYFTL